MNMETLGRMVRHGSAQEIINIRCPNCGKGMRITYVPRGKKALGVVCPSCLSGIWINGVDKEPPWVSELGNSFETGGPSTEV